MLNRDAGRCELIDRTIRLKFDVFIREIATVLDKITRKLYMIVIRLAVCDCCEVMRDSDLCHSAQIRKWHLVVRKESKTEQNDFKFLDKIKKEMQNCFYLFLKIL